MTTLNLVGTHEIQERFGIPRHRVRRFLRRNLWPKPVADLRCGMVFHLHEVEAAVTRLRQRDLL